MGIVEKIKRLKEKSNRQVNKEIDKYIEEIANLFKVEVDANRAKTLENILHKYKRMVRIIKESIDKMKEKIEALEKENKTLKMENENLKRENEKLKSALEKLLEENRNLKK